MSLATTFLASAAPVVVKVQSANMIADTQTHRPALELVVRPGSRAAFDQFIAQHIGQRMVVLVHGKTTLTTVVQKPAASGTMEISSAPLVAMRALIGQLSMRHAKIAIDVAAH